MTRAAGLAGLLLMACGPEALAPPAAVAVSIESSPAPGEVETSPFDHGRPDLTRCLSVPTTCGDTCVEQCRAHEHDRCLAIAEEADMECRSLIGETACNLGHVGSCLDVGRLLQATDHDRARPLLERACHANRAEGCLLLGDIEARLGNRSRAMVRHEQACRLRSADGCTRAAMAYRDPSWSEHDPNRAMKLLGQACRLGEGSGCYEQAKVLLQKPATRDEAISLLEATCLHKPKADGQACYHLAMLMPTPQASVTDATVVLVRGCDKGNSVACHRAAELLYDNKDWPKVIEISNELVKVAPNRWGVWFRRAMSQLNLGRPKEAIPDLEQVCRLRRDWVHCELWLWAARKRVGQPADPKLQARRKAVDASRWPAPVMDHFLGHITAAQLLRKGRNTDARVQNEQLCEAHYYIGMRHLVDGQKAAAKRSFERTVKFQITSFIEHMRALAELDRLAGKGP